MFPFVSQIIKMSKFMLLFSMGWGCVFYTYPPAPFLSRKGELINEFVFFSPLCMKERGWGRVRQKRPSHPTKQ